MTIIINYIYPTTKPDVIVCNITAPLEGEVATFDYVLSATDPHGLAPKLREMLGDNPNAYELRPVRPSPFHEWDEQAGEWVLDEAAFLAAKKAEYEAAIEHHLDAVANSLGYNTIYTALSYKLSNNPKWAAEASALSDWRDSVWHHVHALYLTVTPENIPALEDVIAGLPEYTFVYEE